MEVSAFLLSLGEETAPDALKALENQTRPLKEIVMIEGVVPLARALNEGAGQMTTPAFVQCDADMVLDADCIEVMLEFMREDVGVVSGLLRDEILGSIRGVKLFRTEAFNGAGFPNTVTPGSDFVNGLESRGWRRVFATRGDGPVCRERDTFGEHRPVYTASYTFHRFRRLGTRMRSRGVFSQFQALLHKLGASSHPMAPVAIVGLSRGLCDRELDTGALGDSSASEDFKLLEQYMAGDKDGPDG